MGTLIRSPQIAGQPRRLPLPGGNGAAQSPAPASSVPPLNAEPATDARPQAPVAAPPERAADTLAAEGRAAQAEARAAALGEELQALRDHLDEQREAAKQEGRDAGEQEGRRQVTQETSERAGRLEALLKNLEQSAEKKLASEEDDLAEAVFGAVGKIVGTKLATRRGAAAAVRQVCKQIVKRNGLVVRVAPDDLVFLSEDSELGAALGGKVRFEADAGVALGGCLVESSGGTLDGRLETQLERLKRVLLRARAKRNGGDE